MESLSICISSMMNAINCRTFMLNIKAKMPRSLFLMDQYCQVKFHKEKTKLVQAWIEIHREALMADWELAVNGEAPFRIEPLQ